MASALSFRLMMSSKSELASLPAAVIKIDERIVVFCVTTISICKHVMVNTSRDVCGQSSKEYRLVTRPSSQSQRDGYLCQE